MGPGCRCAHPGYELHLEPILAPAGPTPGRGPKETADFIKAELAKWAPIIKASGAQVTN